MKIVAEQALLLFATAITGAMVGPAAATEDAIPDGGTQYPHFVAMNDTMTCKEDQHSVPFNNQVRGVNLGGWMVLEPWITPSLFYQFLGRTEEDKIGLDTYTFCKSLGAEEANRQLRQHWETWVTEDIIEQLASSGINSIRLPVGDYMYKPYGPYLDGCFDGSLDYVDRLLDWAWANGLNILLDIHTMKDSQNGFDNSGQAMGLKWTTALNNEFVNEQTFEHWPIRDARWMGTFDQATATYTSINHENIQHSLEVIERIVDRYKSHPAVQGLEPINEPWQYTPIDHLKRFYWEGYLIVKKSAPYWKYVMHDSFRLDPGIWGGFMNGCPERVLDTHIYQAWNNPDSRIGFFNNACNVKGQILALEQAFGPVIVGEWSLATDNCAMWLNGFNDNLPGFPRSPCKHIPCSPPYMGEGQPGAPVDPNMPMQGPYGTGMSGPNFGMCPVTRDWIKERNPLTGRDWMVAPPNAPLHYDDTDNVMKLLAYKKISAYSLVGHGFYFWNFRTDLEEPDWSYLGALERGWIPQGNFNNDPKIMDACRSEDNNEYVCQLKKDVPDDAILGAVGWILEQKNGTEFEKSVMGMTGEELDEAGNQIIADFFAESRMSGVTCDFGGIAMLVEQDAGPVDDDFVDWDVAYFGKVNTGPNWWQLSLIIAFGVLFGSLGGFIIGMRYNKGFNQYVSKTKMGKRMTQSSSNLLKNTLSLTDLAGLDLDDMQEVAYTGPNYGSYGKSEKKKMLGGW